MKLERKSEGKQAVVLALSGSLQGGPDAERFSAEIDRLLAEGRRNVLLDLAQVTRVTSTGLGILIAGLASLRRAGGVMKIVNLSDHLESLFAITKLSLVFEVYEDELAALRSFRSGADGSTFE
jgi:anti-sigma B factor antagonist